MFGQACNGDPWQVVKGLNYIAAHAKEVKSALATEFDLCLNVVPVLSGLSTRNEAQAIRREERCKLAENLLGTDASPYSLDQAHQHDWPIG